MAKTPENSPQPVSDIILYQTENGRNKIEAEQDVDNQYIDELKSAALMLEAGQEKVPSKRKGGQR